MEFKLPELGEGIEGGDVIDVLVHEGDQVKKDQTLLELETAKATIPIPSPRAGRIARLHVRTGDHVKVGETLVTIEGSSDGKAPSKKVAEVSAEPPRAEKKESVRPSQRPAMPAGSAAAAAQTKQDEAAPAQRPSAGARSSTEPEAERVPASKTPQRELERQPETVESASDEPVPAGPASRRLARELGVDIRRVSGSGRSGRITEADVKAYVRRLGERGMPQPPEMASRGESLPVAAREAPPLPDFTRWGPVLREPLGSIRRKAAEHVTLAWNLIPHVTHVDEADISNWEAIRQRHSDRVAAAGAKLTVTALALKVTALALKKFPQFNSTLDGTTGQLILKQYYHLGVAVDTDRGLIVPVLRDVDKKTVVELAIELGRVADRARQKKISLEELQGGTFTISNIGGLGGTSFSPIVNYPEVAILGLARAREQQIVRDGATESRLMLPLCLSYDHRVIDGAAAARFTRYLAELFEDPFLIALET